MSEISGMIGHSGRTEMTDMTAMTAGKEMTATTNPEALPRLEATEVVEVIAASQVHPEPSVQAVIILSLNCPTNMITGTTQLSAQTVTLWS